MEFNNLITANIDLNCTKAAMSKKEIEVLKTSINKGLDTILFRN
jgi:hypothetical protein